MNFTRKIISSGLFAAFFLAFLIPSARAQSVLDDIKGRLESEGIAVIDYSSAEGAWGTLPSEWIDYLSESYANLGDMAEKEKLDDYFVGEGSLTALRRDLSIAIAFKSTLADQAEIEAKNEEILNLNSQIFTLEKEAKEDILDVVEDNLNTDIDLGDLLLNIQENKDEIVNLETEVQTKEAELEGSIPQKNLEIDALERDLRSLENLFNDNGGNIINLIFSEIDFYYNYSKWGRLPLRIIGVLEGTEEEKFQSLLNIIEHYQMGGTFDEDGLRNDLTGITDGGGKKLLSDDDISLIIDSTLIMITEGEAQINQIGRAIADSIKNLAGALAVIWIIIAGLRLVLAQGDENVITEQKRALTYGIVGLVIILLVDRLIETIYGAPGVIRTSLIKDQGFSNEVYGVIYFIKAIIGTIAILFIVLSGLKTIFAQGDEDQIKKQRQSVLYIGAGLLLMAIDQIIIDNIFIIPTQEQSDQIKGSNVNSLINLFGTVLQFILGFVGLIAFAMLVYGAATMIMNYGNDEMVERSKKIIKNALIGILVVLSAYTIVATLVVFR